MFSAFYCATHLRLYRNEYDDDDDIEQMNVLKILVQFEEIFQMICLLDLTRKPYR